MSRRFANVHSARSWCRSLVRIAQFRFWENQRFDEDERRLEIRCRAEWETLLAVVALLGGDLRKETNLFSDASVYETNRV